MILFYHQNNYKKPMSYKILFYFLFNIRLFVRIPKLNDTNRWEERLIKDKLSIYLDISL